MALYFFKDLMSLMKDSFNVRLMFTLLDPSGKLVKFSRNIVDQTRIHLEVISLDSEGKFVEFDANIKDQTVALRITIGISSLTTSSIYYICTKRRGLHSASDNRYNKIKQFWEGIGRANCNVEDLYGYVLEYKVSTDMLTLMSGDKQISVELKYSLYKNVIDFYLKSHIEIEHFDDLRLSSYFFLISSKS